MDPTPNVASSKLFDLKGNNVLITGATRGIGAACALALAQAGASCLILVVRPGTEKTAIASACEATGAVVHQLEADLTVPDDVRGIFDRALALAPGNTVDILVNCAGIQRRHPSVDFPEDDFDEVMQVNFKTVWLLSQAAGRHMVPRRKGKIISFASLLTFQGGLTVPAYASAKGALGQMTKALSNEWAKHNVQVNAIAPGYIATDMNEKLLADPVRLAQISDRIPAGRWGAPEDFAGPVVFLASTASQYVSGEVLLVDGGWMGR